jgi:drug/metabolite transporter (DMT)-like permease
MHIGELAALGTAFCWTASALTFERATARVGSLAVNLYKLAFALCFLMVFCTFWRGQVLPFDAPAETWFYLGLSGLAGFTLGDIFLFTSYSLVGSRMATLFQALVPPLTAIIGFVFLGERLSALNLLGMTLTVGGIATVILGRKPGADAEKPAEADGGSRPSAGKAAGERSRWIKGLVYAFIGAVGQAVGLILSKRGIGTYDAFAATQIRIIAGLAGFAVLASIMKRWKPVVNTLRDGRSVKFIFAGSIVGPCIGVSLSVLAVQLTTAGAASTIMALVPVLIIPPTVLFMKQKTSIREIAGALVAVGGVALFFL